MSQQDATFEDTLDRLESERESVEAEYQRHLSMLEECVERLAAAIEELGRAVDAQDEARAAITSRVEQRLTAAPSVGGQREPEMAPWPNGGGLLRGFVNRVVRWGMRDYLQAIDQRTDRLSERLDLLTGVFGDLLAATGGAAAAGTSLEGARPQGGELGTIRAAHAAFVIAGEAMVAAADVHRSAHRVVNAKDAELLQRAAAGPLRRMELVFDEFGRQQEALLAHLIGRRQELDALIAELRGDEETA